MTHVIRDLLAVIAHHVRPRPTPEGKPAVITYVSTTPSRSRMPRRAA